MKRFRNRSYLLLFALILLTPRNASTCGPFFPEAIFTYQVHPGKPMKWFADGNLGVVLPSFARGYLVVAYRYLAGRPLSAGERRDTIDYWRWRMQSPNYDAQEQKADLPEKEWLDARGEVTGPTANQPTVSIPQKVDRWDYQQYVNCQPDAFHHAALTLLDRAKRFGAKSDEIQEWIRGQDAVFSNCSSKGTVPAMIAESRPAVLKADRRYQIAAADFYQRDFKTAAQQFDQIAQDQESPWHALAPYLAARSIWREAVLSNDNNKQDMEQAYQRLQKILDDPNEKSMHHAARELMGYVAFRLYPAQREGELAKALSGPGPDPDFYQDIIDYSMSLDRTVGDREPYSLEEAKASPETQAKIAAWYRQEYQRLAAARASVDLTDWILTFKEPGKEATAHAISMWRKQHNAAWLVAALSRVEPSDAAAPELMGAAEHVPASSPAYPTLACHRIRLLMAKGQNEAAGTLVNQVLAPEGLKLTSSSRNMFLAQRMRLATGFEDFLGFVARPLVDTDDGSGFGPELGMLDKKSMDELLFSKKEPTERRFDHTAAMVLNMQMPLELLQQASVSDKIPTKLRGELAVATWTRAVMLGRHDVGEALIPAVESVVPGSAPWLKSYAAAQGAEEKWHAALFMILHFPGFRPYVNAGMPRETAPGKIDSFRDNWWCVDVGADVSTTNYAQNDEEWGSIPRNLNLKGNPNSPGYPAFLTAAQVQSAGSEWKELSAVGTGPNYLTREVLRWARLNPTDPRIPEALYLAVRSTRYGCDNKETRALSKKAFELLHSRYGKSEWARKTRYWFGS
jgi:hypothetical protein